MKPVLPEVYFYKCFGKLLQSEIPIVELTSVTQGSPDLKLVRGAIDRPFPQLPHIDWVHEFGPDDYHLGLCMTGNYRLQDTTITYDQAPELPDGFIGFTLLGTIMAAVMHRCGHLVLHGSALLVEGKAVVFLGDKGAGKSTTAGGLISAGYQLISDDVIAVAADASGALCVTPAYPMIKLSDAALAVFGMERFELVPTATDQLVKNRALVKTGVPDAPVPIAAIYELTRGTCDEAPAIEPLPQTEALQLLFAHSYMARYGQDAFKAPGAMVRHLQQCSGLTRQVRISRLIAPGDIARLGEVATIVASDVVAR